MVFCPGCNSTFQRIGFPIRAAKMVSLVTGFCLAAAILCRPDVFTLWPALLAIAIQKLNAEKKSTEKRSSNGACSQRSR